MRDLCDDGFNPNDYDDPEPRRGRGYLEIDVNFTLKSLEEGKISHDPSKPLTASEIIKLMVPLLELEKKPSQGAVYNLLIRWRDNGYANVSSSPVAFQSFTQSGRLIGLQEFNKRVKYAKRLQNQLSSRRADG